MAAATCRTCSADPPRRKPRALEGSYAGFQPKPAVEVVLVVMKPLSEGTYVDQAMANGLGITWLDDCRIPVVDEDAQSALGRFPANLLVSDDALGAGPEGHSRYFSLDAWWTEHMADLPEDVQAQLPFLVVPKPSKREKNAGLDGRKQTTVGDGRKKTNDTAFQRGATERSNPHPSVSRSSLWSI